MQRRKLLLDSRFVPGGGTRVDAPNHNGTEASGKSRTLQGLAVVKNDTSCSGVENGATVKVTPFSVSVS